MSQQDKSENAGKPAPSASSSQPASSGESAPAQADATKPGLKYVFKIAPADPKRNSIDFEDVADK